jgi:hypothetical protein
MVGYKGDALDQLCLIPTGRRSAHSIRG